MNFCFSQLTKPRRLSILGATGSIGSSTVDIISRYPDLFDVHMVSAQRNFQKLAEIVRLVGAKVAVIEDESFYGPLKEQLSNTDVEVYAGRAALLDAATAPVDILISALTGIAGLEPTFRALGHARAIGLANKEVIVTAGPLFLDAARQSQTVILPLDSEHNAIFQVLQEGHRSHLRSLTITASGGPFRMLPEAEFSQITKAQALKHPNWSMGYKNTIDSATLANKGLELIEAAYLFDVPEPQVEVVVHPQQLIHAFVTFEDGSSLAQMGVPDMRTPISYALAWPQRVALPVPSIDLISAQQLTFEKPDLERFPALKLAREALRHHAVSVIAFNAANEVAVNALMADQIRFVDIPVVIEKTLLMMPVGPITDIAGALHCHKKAALVAKNALLTL